MTIEPITSLADLSFKCKTSKRYRQLALLGCEHYGYYNVRDYTSALKRLNKLAVNHNPNSCIVIVGGINSNRTRIQTEAQLRSSKSSFIRKIEDEIPKTKKKRRVAKLKRKV